MDFAGFLREQVHVGRSPIYDWHHRYDRRSNLLFHAGSGGSSWCFGSVGLAYRTRHDLATDACTIHWHHGFCAMEKTEKLIELNSEITCPHCGHKSIEVMPVDA